MKKTKLVSSLTIRKQYFVAINLLGEWGYMQKIMAIMSEGLPQKLKCIKMGLEERGVFKLSSMQTATSCQEESMYWERDCLAVASSQIILRAS